MNINKFNESLKFIHKKAKRRNIEISSIGAWSNSLYFFGITEDSKEDVIAAIHISRETIELKNTLGKDGCIRQHFKVDEEGCVFEIEY